MEPPLEVLSRLNDEFRAGAGQRKTGCATDDPCALAPWARDRARTGVADGADAERLKLWSDLIGDAGRLRFRGGSVEECGHDRETTVAEGRAMRFPAQEDRYDSVSVSAAISAYLAGVIGSKRPERPSVGTELETGSFSSAGAAGTGHCLQ